MSLEILANQQFEQIESARLKIDFAKDPIHSLMVSLQYSFLRKIPYMRLLAFQLNTILRNNNGGGVSTSDVVEEDGKKYVQLLNLVFQRLSHSGVENNLNVLIFYHPHLKINFDGSVFPDTDAGYLKLFKTACDNNGIYFVDMTEPFLQAYNEQHILPHGFWNTRVGAGHLNKNGHRIIAGELYNRIK